MTTNKMKRNLERDQQQNNRQNKIEKKNFFCVQQDWNKKWKKEWEEIK